MNKYFKDRRSAGRELAAEFSKYAMQPDILVLGLPRGGIPVAYEIARSIEAPLDVFIVHKLGTPGQPELAMGAIAPNDTLVLNRDIIQLMHIPQSLIDAEIQLQKEGIAKRENAYRMKRQAKPIKGKTVIVVDDGLATGATMKVAVKALRQMLPSKIVVAVPVADEGVCREVGAMVDEIVCAYTPYPLAAIGMWYEDFTQTSDEEVQDLLQRADNKYFAEENMDEGDAA